MPRSALFVIDIQRELAHNPTARIPHAEQACPAGEKILSVARGIMDPYSGSEDQQKQQFPWIIVIIRHEEKPKDGRYGFLPLRRSVCR